MFWQLKKSYRAGLLLEGGEGGAGRLLDPLVTIQDPLQQLW